MSWQKAMILWFQEKIEVLETHERIIHSPRSQIHAPAVVKMRSYVKPRSNRTVRLSRENIFLRDQSTCQYCCKKMNMKDLTLDHVHPVSRGGGKSWENLVAACHPCNRKKGNRTPEEAKMPLLNKPGRLSWNPSMDLHVKPSDKVEYLWRPYLQWAWSVAAGL